MTWSILRGWQRDQAREDRTKAADGMLSVDHGEMRPSAPRHDDAESAADQVRPPVTVTAFDQVRRVRHVGAVPDTIFEIIEAA